MRPALQPHVDTPCPAVKRLEVLHDRPELSALVLRFFMSGDIGSLLIPAPSVNQRTDGLWKHTCFEAFVWPGGGDTYFEFNVSPSKQWAAYAFDSYRTGMRPLDIGPPQIEFDVTEERLEISATFELNDDRNWQVKPTAVIETAGGQLSYWAFEHPPGRPDFHHRSGYSFALRPAEST